MKWAALSDESSAMSLDEVSLLVKTMALVELDRISREKKKRVAMSRWHFEAGLFSYHGTYAFNSFFE